MKYRVAISGSYGGMNLGDEAILEVILRELRAKVECDITVFSVNPEDTQKRHKIRAVPIRQLHKNEVVKELKDLDLFILGGGGILFDQFAEIFLRDVVWAKELGIPVFVYAISAGPLKTAESRKMVVEVLNTVDTITVREGEAKKLLCDLGVTKDIEVTGDPALLMLPQEFPSQLLEQKMMDHESPLVGFSVREPGLAAQDLVVEQYHHNLANAADFLVERFHAQILFVPMELGEHKDLQHSHGIISKMTHAKRASVLMGEYPSAQVLGLVQHLIFSVGMRLHFLIFSAIQGVPFVPLPYASKVTGFLSDLKMPMTPIHEINPGKLCAYLDKAWDGRNDIKKRLEENVPILKAAARRTNQILVEKLTSLKPKSD